MASRFLMQIVDRKTGEVVQMEPGQGLECSFVRDSVRQAMRRGMGVMGRRLLSAGDIQDAIEAAILDLKRRVRV